jgi:hypothetical protein
VGYVEVTKEENRQRLGVLVAEVEHATPNQRAQFVGFAVGPLTGAAEDKGLSPLAAKCWAIAALAGWRETVGTDSSQSH